MADDNSTPSPLQWVRTADFADVYANNVRFESSVWDLKSVFGVLDQGTPNNVAIPPSVRFHTAIAVPWVQAKIMAYNMYLNVMFHEHTDGTIKIPASVMPPSLETLIPTMAETPEGRQLIERDKKLRADLFGE